MPYEGPWRPSDVGTWQQCGHRYELMRERHEKPAWRHPKGLNGTAIHLVVRQIHEEGLWAAPMAEYQERWKAAFVAADEEPYEESDMGVPVWWGKMVDRAGAITELKWDAMAMLSGYAGDPRNKDANLLDIESHWETEIAGVPMRGRIDQVRDLHGLHILDLKTTGMEKPSANFMALWTQGLVYAAAVEKILKERPKTVTWLHMRDYIPYKTRAKAAASPGPRGQVYYTAEVTENGMKSLEKELRMFHDAVRAGRFERRPTPNGCSWCKVADLCVAGFRGAPTVGVPAGMEVADEDF